MIDLDRMDEQLAAALTDVVGPALTPRAPVPAPTPAPAPTSAPAPVTLAARHRPSPPVRQRRRPVAPAAASATLPPPSSVAELLELGLLEEAEARAAASADRVDRLSWATMRALLEGRDDVAAGLEDLLAVARSAGDDGAGDRYWLPRFWAAVQGGSGDERYDVLDHCRERAYRFDEVQWWGDLTLLLAAMGKHDEATRAFDETEPLIPTAADDRMRLDVVTNLVEAAALLDDAGRATAASRHLRAPEGRLVVVGPAAVCKGSVERYRALGHVAAGRYAEAEECFRSAEATHRALGAGPLLARTRQQAVGGLVAA